ncbi:Peroxidase 52 precursor [Zea mays]|uniref:Peroxidase n=1 Tax=Zea mays TaxID=4577 RepID=B6SRR3_MAIZE|nr:Peroxidase 52 precursor [Zea mays]ACG27546.1 peroxidase 52 precursor [Zea mays]AQL06813.1 Peroxidase 52 [Zea mays]|eukprot:NP_001147443.1 peroxidase 52 precursor [Zea mays]
MVVSILTHPFMAAAACVAVALALLATTSSAQLDPHFYDKACPAALPTIKRLVEEAVAAEPRMGASLLRLHFHDCFVNGCDGSILLDDTPFFTGETMAAPNANSVRGFDVIDRIKGAVNAACRGNVVSCADVVAIAARDSVVALGGPSYDVPLGRRDARTASQAAANSSIPAPTFGIDRLASNFASHGLSLQDLVALSGAHTLGFSRCTNFRDRLYNETATLDGSLAASLRAACPRAAGTGDDSLAPLDPTPARFDAAYFASLLRNRGVLHSDQQLFAGGPGVADALVRLYAADTDAFRRDFADAMVRMGSLSPLTGSNGEIRYNCRKVNYS